jgi:hypothetical protein
MFTGTTIEDLLMTVERAEQKAKKSTVRMSVKVSAPRFEHYRTFIYEMQYTEPMQIGAA